MYPYIFVVTLIFGLLISRSNQHIFVPTASKLCNFQKKFLRDRVH